jgi:superoxide reductase
MLENNGVPIKCCGEVMEEIVPETNDEKGEKHVPIYRVENNHVIINVGKVEHPMEEEHHIKWICVQTTRGFHIRYLSFKTKPEITVGLANGEKVESVFAYCNIHSLWKA